jgi:hypothetical protein
MMRGTGEWRARPIATEPDHAVGGTGRTADHDYHGLTRVRVADGRAAAISSSAMMP